MTLHDAPARVDADHRPDGVLEAARRLTPILPIGLCLLVVMVATGLAIVHVLDGVREWDLDMMRRLVESRTTTLDRLTEWGTWFAETIPVVVITVVVVADPWPRHPVPLLRQSNLARLHRAEHLARTRRARRRPQLVAAQKLASFACKHGGTPLRRFA